MWMGQGGREGGLGVRTNGLQGFCFRSIIKVFGFAILLVINNFVNPGVVGSSPAVVNLSLSEQR